MKKLITFIYLCTIATSIYSQNVKIKGTVVENSNKTQTAMEGVSISLLNLDSMYVTGDASDKKGAFVLSNVKPGDYSLNLTFVGFQLKKIMLKNVTGNIDLGTIEMEEATQELKGVTVTASNIINKVDRMVVLPTQSALKNAYDSYELLNNLNISRLKVNPISKTMEFEGRGVQTRINGIVASSAEVSALRASDVLRINVIENPGERYGDLNLGAVIDIIVRRSDFGGLVNLQTMNSPFVLFGENNVSVKFNQKKSQWGLNYNLSNRGFNKMRTDNNEIFYLQDKTINRIQEGINDTTKFFNHNITLSYNLSEPDKYTFNVAFRNGINNQPANNQSAKLYNAGSQDFIYSKTKNNSSNYSPALDIYFQKNLAHQQSIQFDVVGTLINTDAYRSYREYTSTGTDLTWLDMDVTGKKRSIIGEAIYDKTLKAAKLSAGVRHSQMFLENDYSGTNPVISTMNQAQSSAFVQAQGKVKDFGYFGSIGMTRSFFAQDNLNHTYYTFTPSVSLSYDLHKKGYISYRFSTSPRIPSLSSLTNVEQSLDTIQIVRGNPLLKPYSVFNNNLSYNFGYKKFFGAINIGHIYENKSIMESYSVEGNKLIIMDENQKSGQLLMITPSFGLNGVDVGSFKNFLTINFSPGYFKYWIDGNTYYHTYGNFFYDVSMILKYKSFSFMSQYVKTWNRLWGETINIGENQTMFMLTYTKNRLQVGAGIMFPFTNNYRTGQERISSIAPSTSWTYCKEAGQLAFIQFNYNFEFKNKYRTGEKRLNNSDNDSGIINTNR